PGGLKQWIGDQTDDRRNCDQKQAARLPAKQDGERPPTDNGGKRIADGDASKQKAGPQYGADGRRISSADETLNVAIGAMPHEQRCRDQNEYEGREEDADGRDQRPPEAGDQI